MALAVALLVPATSAAGAPTEPELLGIPRVPFDAAADRSVPPPASSGATDAPADVPTRPLSATGSWHFFDYCGDARRGRLDLRQLHLRAGPDGHLEFRFELCAPTSVEQLEGRGLVANLVDSAPSGRAFEVWITAGGGGLEGVVIDKDRRRIVETRTASLLDGRHVARVAVPNATLGDPQELVFEALSVDRDGELLDLLPEFDEDYLDVVLSDGPCTGGGARTVRALPGQLDRARRAAEAAGLAPTGVHRRSGRFVVQPAPDATDAQLAALDGVAAVEPAVTYQREAAGTAPTDTSPWWRAQVHADARLDRTGAGTTIGVLDDGIDGARPEFGIRVVSGYDAVRDRSIGARERSDRGGHGTAVAGVAAADSTQVRGIAPAATLRPYNVFDAAGCAYEESIAEAVDRATAAGVDVINLSLGNDDPTPPLLGDALARARAAGVLVVAAAGNAGRLGPASPGDHPATLAVGATTAARNVASYSNGGSWLDLVAPGGQPTGSPSTAIVTLGERGGLTAVAGTSFAAPIVAGAAARAIAASDVDAAAFRALATGTAEDLPPAGYDEWSGHGLLRVDHVLADAPDGRPSPRPLAPACDGAPAAPFPDATGTHAAGIGCIAHWRVAGGFPDGTYRPARAVTRGQMATFLVNLVERAGGSLPPPGPNLADTRGTTHEVAIRRLVAADIAGGFSDGTYRPTAPVTRAQMGTFLVRALEHRTQAPLPRRAIGFHDTRRSAHEERIEQAATAGLTGGDGTGYYRPGRDVTRGQMGSFLARTLAFLVEEADVTPPER